MKFKYLKDVVTLEYDQDKCTGCGMCLQVCPHGIFRLNDHKAVIADRDLCMECGACAKNCPFAALRVRAGVGCAYGILAGQIKGGEPCCG
jgi:NAD-dependent dihydropyrimidine dehydrogenase PreA subunit